MIVMIMVSSRSKACSWHVLEREERGLVAA